MHQGKGLADAAPVGGGWSASELSPAAWALPMPDRVRQELRRWSHAAVAGERPDTAGLTHALDFSGTVRCALEQFPGFCLVRGFQPDSDDRRTWLALLAFTSLLGEPVSQNVSGQHLIRVEDRGAKPADHRRRGHYSRGELPYHADRTDVVALLCVRPARQGGLSRVVSSRQLHDLVVSERLESADILYRPLPHDRRGEERPGEPPWSEIPVFFRDHGRLGTRYVRRFIDGSQRHLGAPRLGEDQVAALDFLDSVLERPGLAQEMAFEPGDLQLLNNFDVLHSRTAFDDAPTGPDGAAAGGGRLLLRVWLAWDASPALPSSYASLYGATAAGTYRGGVHPPDAAVPTGRPVARGLPDTREERWARLHLETEERAR